jgi:hypothetical protein
VLHVPALLLVLLFACCSPRSAQASVTVLIGEPFDKFGTLIPVGHATIYLDTVCADGPLKVRMCRPGEPAGVAIARYDLIGQYDWLATPIMQFLYATSRADEVLTYATPEQVDGLRTLYRKRYLMQVFPDSAVALKSNEEWWESAGIAYTRGLWGYQIATTRAQDERVVAALNSRVNRHIFNVYHANCANFAADVLNLYVPHLVKRNRFADLGFLLPKQVARCVYLYGLRHPEARLRVFEIPQVPGSIPRSHPVRGGAEAFIKTKRYIVPLSILQPEIAVTLLAFYLDHGRWTVARPAEIEGPEALQQSRELITAMK